MLIETYSQHRPDAEGIELTAEIEQISIVVFYFKLSKGCRVLALERVLFMMLLLAEDVLNYVVNLRMTVRECSITLLPPKIEFRKSLILDKFDRRLFDFTNEV